MPAAPSPTPAPAPPGDPERPKIEFDPEGYRMTLGEHLEELRKRVIHGLLGAMIALVVCLAIGEPIVVFFSKPLLDGLKEAGINPQMHVSDITNPFMLYMKVSAIVAGTVAGPWMLYQLWLFVSAGLYPPEQKIIKRYIPLSVILLISGMVLAYLVVMPLTVKFLLAFNGGFDMPGMSTRKLVDVALPATRMSTFTILPGDPRNPQEGWQWFNSLEGKYKFFQGGHTSVLQYAQDALLAQSITMDTYVDMTLMTLLVFALAFQLPLAVLALHTIGVLDIPTLKKSRRIVYFALAVAAAVIAPGDVVSAMMALYIPLILLFEFGIVLCWWSDRTKRARGLNV